MRALVLHGALPYGAKKLRRDRTQPWRINTAGWGLVPPLYGPAESVMA
jgi:hypothetical protein